MQLYKRKSGEEQPFWPLGPFKVRLPLVHYRWETAEMVQGLVLFVISLSMIPILENQLGLPYDVALAYVLVCQVCFMLPAMLGVPFIPGWITPALPLVLVFLGNFEPGPEAIQAMFALQFLVFLIFFILGVTGLGSALVRIIPASLKAGMIIGAGIAALFGEFEEGGRVAETPIAITVGFFISLFLIFGVAFQDWIKTSRLAKIIASYGIVPGMLAAIGLAWIIGEYDLPSVEWGITQPAFTEMWAYLPFSVGFPSLDVFMLAVPMALVAYVIAFGDIIVARSLVARVDDMRPDEKIDYSIDRAHHVTGLRNFIHCFFAPYPGLAGPVFTAGTATIAERYKQGPEAMESIFSGGGTFMVTWFIAIFMLPLITTFEPVLPIALSLTLLLTGYICLMVGMEEVSSTVERGVAGTMGVILALYGAGWGLAAGVVLYYLVEKKNLFGWEVRHHEHQDSGERSPEGRD